MVATAEAARRVPGLGLLTVQLHFKQRMEGLTGITDAANFAAANRYNALQVAMFRSKNPRDFSAETLQARWAIENRVEANTGCKSLFETTGVTIDSVAFCDNILGNPADKAHLEDVIRAGGIIGAGSVVTFIGNANSLMREAGIPFQGPGAREFFLEQVARTFNPLVQMARDEGNMELHIENCPMGFAMDPNGLTGVTNLFSSPSLVRDVLGVVPGLFLHFDPSHVKNYAAGEEDPAATRTISEWISNFGPSMGMSCHLKDSRANRQGLRDHQSLGDPFNSDTHTQGLWEAVAPNGTGEINWPTFERNMAAHAPFCGARIVELEDVSAQGRSANELLFISTANYYRDEVFKPVYGSTGE